MSRARRRGLARLAVLVCALVWLGSTGFGALRAPDVVDAGVPGASASPVAASNRPLGSARSGGWTRSAGPSSPASTGGAALLAPPSDPVAGVLDRGVPVLAEVGGVVLYRPPGTAEVGFHEASRVGGERMRPFGAPITNENTTRFDPTSDAAPSGRDGVLGSAYRILSSRGRSAGPTTAVDLAMLVDHEVASPVDGTVVDVTTYWLHAVHEDRRVVVRPDANADLQVILIHLDDVLVRAGDRVIAGETPLAARARVFPFGSQIDLYTEDDRGRGRLPHVHVEVRPA